MLAADQRLSEMMMERRERRQRRSTGEKAPLAQLPWKQPRRHFAPLRLLSDDQIETIHKGILDLLEEIGMDILNPEARQIFSRAGAIVADERVRIGRDIVEAGIGTAPEEFTFMHATRTGRSASAAIDRLRAGGRTAELLRCRSRPAPRHLRGQCQLHLAGAAFQLHPPPAAARRMPLMSMPRCGNCASA